jgi:hypothetical protein
MLYCECFASGEYCLDGCNCRDCANNQTHEDLRAQAITAILQKNAKAFKPKIGQGAKVVEQGQGAQPVTRHTKGTPPLASSAPAAQQKGPC